MAPRTGEPDQKRGHDQVSGPKVRHIGKPSEHERREAARQT
jgi:hypothetical protein